MSVQEVIARCRDLGVTLAPGPGGRLRVAPPGRLPEELREELKRYKREVLALLLAEKAEESGKPDYCGLYRELARNPLFDDFPAVDGWLCDHHPALWRKIRELDDILTCLEKEGAEGEVYRAKLEELLDLCQKAQAMKKHEEGLIEGGRTLAVHHCGGTRFWLSRYSDLWICEKCNSPGEGSAKRWIEAGELVADGVCFAQ